MVGIKSDGRLGNQMFQFAFIYNYAKLHNTKFFIDEFDALEYFECSNEFYFRNSFNKLHAKLLSLLGKFKTTTISNLDPNFKVEIKKHRNNTLFAGYFQSNICFNGARDEIKSLFQIKKKYKSSAPLNYPYIGIHIRLGDYTNLDDPRLGNDISLSKEYYLKALEEIYTESYRLVVVSDNIENAKELLPENYTYTFCQSTEIFDFQILLNAEKLVISNSSFSWWAAFLNKKSAEVIAPRFWMGTNTKAVYPTYIFENLNWKLIDN